MSEVLPEFQAQPPTEISTMLDTLFLRALNWEGLGTEVSDLPSHIAVCFSASPTEGFELLQVANWNKKRKLDIIRPTLDASNIESLESPDGSFGFSYRIHMEDMFERPFIMSDDGEDEVIVHQSGYDIYNKKIVVWGNGTDTTYFCALEPSDQEYRIVTSHISSYLELESLASDFELLPSLFEE